jgi:broad specificity phosphatase PhoE
VADATTRLRVVAHGPTARASALVLGDAGALLRPPAPESAPREVTAWWSGPGTACAETLAGWGVEGELLPGLAGPDLGRWTGRTLREVGADDPAGLHAWSGDVVARPHGGETLAELVGRVGTVLEAQPWPAGTSGLVVEPVVARALTVAALGAPASVLPALDVGFGGQLLLTRSGSRWRLQELLRRPAVPTPPG